jgi:hypothetical protein
MARASKGTTKVGYENRNGQIVVRATDKLGTDFGQKVYVLRCRYCAKEYGANGTDIHSRRCPYDKHGDSKLGRPGLEFE